MKLYKIENKPLLDINGDFYLGPDADWDQLLGRDRLKDLLYSEAQHWEQLTKEEAGSLMQEGVQAPMGNQEVWAAGVTYYRSRTARMEESLDAGGADFYDKVYDANRPELFFKATASRVSNPGEKVNIRKDSTWDVPEPELTLLLSPSGKVQGFTIGNDMSSRSIEGENPLYLPQAKMYLGSAALGPCILIQNEIDEQSTIQLRIFRNTSQVFSEKTELTQLKRKPQELADWLFRSNVFPLGCFLMTGTGIVPDNFTLEQGDRIQIEIEGIGILENLVGKI
ncbi:2-dehydro-3-deoxy-D-arabinonate dehydratase [Algoriphagus faecimaris]|uniref:2-dehydro-3-deoxy-D-arabinonate dehydratase n=1 Tax=Algoriphagus faecimaris TaxID=686796 RepID=A0A1G6TIC6_9BACT|nr:fumarylacetoacetate hydrolase family protein [Algoriphagus faecimaris]SDD28823.1 2-dehydro-3-deoxy-D-arabinonate dehydratase [Algoriphagus faecimaris]